MLFPDMPESEMTIHLRKPRKIEKNAISSFSYILIAISLMGPGRAACAQEFMGEHQDGTLCKADEVIIFSCNTKQKKIAVCARHQDDALGSFSYRFGTPGSIELDFPRDAKPTSSYVSGNILSASESAYLGYLKLKNGNTTYSVFEEALSPEYASPGNGQAAKKFKPGHVDGGVIVEAHGSVVAKIMCNPHDPILFHIMTDPGVLNSDVPLDKDGFSPFPNYRRSGLNNDVLDQ
jgi:hypothetical protein